MLRGGQTKIGKLHGHTLVLDQDVLRLQIPVVDTNGMTELHGVQDLEEDTLGQSIVTKITPALSDVRKEITLRTELKDDESAIGTVHDLGH